jgi:RNA polymerase sigma-70 factor (ECF subfamily)
VYGDGGGKAPAWPRPIFGRHQVATLLAAVGVQMHGLPTQLRSVHRSTDSPGRCSWAVFLDADGLINVMALDIVDGVVQTVRSIINPEKLGHLGELADVRALLRARRQDEEHVQD